MDTAVLAVDIAGNFQAGAAILAGLVGAVAMLAVIYGGRAMGMTRMDLLATLGTMVAPKGATTVVYSVGAMMHPLVRSGDMPAPGAAMTKLGKMTPMGIVMAHIVFGLVAGAIYVGIVG